MYECEKINGIIDSIENELIYAKENLENVKHFNKINTYEQGYVHALEYVLMIMKRK